MGSQLTAREKILLQRLLKNNFLSLGKFAKTPINIDKLDFETLREIVQGIVETQNKPQGPPWTLKQQIVALSIFIRSSKAYSYLQTLIPLPSTKLLQRLLNDISINTGIYHNILKIMKKRVKKVHSLDRHCTLLFDEVALKKTLVYNEMTDEVDGFEDYGSGESMGRHNNIADRAIVFMVQGIRKKYIQPVAHYFVAGPICTEKLATIIKKVIEVLTKARFKVIATVCSTRPTNMGALDLLSNTGGELTGNYYFYCPQKIYIIYDVPHLLKSVRNNFLKGGIIKFKNYTAKWQHLIQAEERNRELNFIKLTQKIVNPTYTTKMRVKYAAHALSNTMSGMLKLMSLCQGQELMETAKVVEELDKLFNCTNGPASRDEVIKGVREIVYEKSFHIDKWNYYLNVLDSLVFVNSETLQPLQNVRCIKGFQITLNSLKDIWNILEKAEFQYMNLRQFNKDSLENLFGVIRQHNVFNRNVTCTYFTDSLKTVITSGLMASHSRGSKCEDDGNKLLLRRKHIRRSQKNKPKGDKINQNRIVDKITRPVLSLPKVTDFAEYENSLCGVDEQPVVCLSGYLAARLLTNTSCKACTKSLKVDNLEDDPMYNGLREWWNDEKSLTCPTASLCNFVNEAQNLCNSEISKNLHNKNICQKISLQISIINLDWFQCKEHFDKKTKRLVHILALLCIRKSCNIKNISFKKCRQDLDKTKQAQVLQDVVNMSIGEATQN